MSDQKAFHFRVFRKKAICEALGVEQETTFTLDLTQEQFEDYQLLKDRIHAQLDAIGIPQSEHPYWREDPPVETSLISKIKAVLGCKHDDELIPYYAHSFHHRHYKMASIDGIVYRYMGFQNGHFIKFAPAL
jgi:hypothetical protein